MAKLIICVDGLGKDLVNEKDTPFLYKFGRENYQAELETLFAFTGLEYCFFSGENPLKSGIWFEFVKSKNSLFDSSWLRFFSFNKKFRNYVGAFIQLINKRSYVCGLHNIPLDRLKYFDVSVEKGLWNLDFFKGKKFSFYKWPFFITDEKGKIIFKYEDDDERLERLLGVDGKDIYYTQLMSVDKVVHRYGKNSLEVREVVREINRILERYVNEFLSVKGNEVFIWSDHGFADVENYINILDYLPDREDYLYFIGGTTAHFWFENLEVREKVLDSLKKIKNVKILDSKKAGKFKIPLDSKYGELIAYVEKGNYFFPNYYQASGEERFVSMHGYPDDRELNGFFMSNRRIDKNRLKMEEVIKVLEWGNTHSEPGFAKALRKNINN